MAGFAGCNDKPTDFNTILDRVTTSLGITEAVRFGEAAKGSGQVFDATPVIKAVHCPPFYNRLQNPDYALYQRALTDSTGSAYLYITDGVQSDWQGRNPGPSVAALRDWVSTRGLAILAFRSEFSGQGWSEQRQQMIGTVSEEERPFYLFILAHSDVAVDDVLRKLPQSLVGQATMIRFAKDGVRCRVDVTSGIPKYASAQSVRWSMLQWRSIPDDRALFTHKCDLRKDYPLKTVSPRASGRQRQWKNAGFGNPSEIEPRVWRIESGTTETTGSITPIGVHWEENKQTRFEFFEIRVDSDAGLLRDDIDSLSADADVSIESFSRTYRFSWLIEELAGAHVRRVGWAPLSLTLQYR